MYRGLFTLSVCRHYTIDYWTIYYQEIDYRNNDYRSITRYRLTGNIDYNNIDYTIDYRNIDYIIDNGLSIIRKSIIGTLIIDRSLHRLSGNIAYRETSIIITSIIITSVTPSIIGTSIILSFTDYRSSGNRLLEHRV